MRNNILHLLFIAICLTLCSCGMSQAEKNVQDYVVQQILEADTTDQIKDVDVELQDSLQNPQIVTDLRANMARYYAEFLRGNMKADQFSELLNQNAEILRFVTDSWKQNGAFDRSNPLYATQNQTCAVYRVHIESDKVPTRDIRVVMGEDGLTPRTTDEQVLREIQGTQELLAKYQIQLDASSVENIGE